MSEPGQAIAGTFVEPRGMIRSIVAGAAGGEALGAVGAAAASAAASHGLEDSSPLRKGQIAYLSVSEEEVVICRAKRGAFRPKATEERIATAPRTNVSSANVEKGRIAGTLKIAFDDGESWTFDVPKVHLGGAHEIAAALRP